MLDLVWLLFVIIIVVLLSLFSLIGNTGDKPGWWVMISLVFGVIHAWLLSTWANFIVLIWDPAWEVIFGLRPLLLYEFTAFLLLFSMVFFVLSSIRTLIVMWNEEGIITLQA